MTTEGQLPLSIDWEDWFQLCCPPYDLPGALEAFEDRLARATDATLSLCSEVGATATWFCLGEQAHRHPELVKRIAAAGHRIGVHGDHHVRAYERGRVDWRGDLVRTRALLQDLTGQPVEGYRAVEWSLRGPAEDWWQDLPEMGFRFDSSRAPLKVIGDPARPRRAHRLPNGLWELPPPVFHVIPLWGWGQRCFPPALLQAALAPAARTDAGTPLVLHPWELDPAQPKLPVTTFGHAFAHGAGALGLADRLRQTWSGFHLEPLEAWVARAEARP